MQQPQTPIRSEFTRIIERCPHLIIRYCMEDLKSRGYVIADIAARSGVPYRYLYFMRSGKAMKTGINVARLLHFFQNVFPYTFTLALESISRQHGEGYMVGEAARKALQKKEIKGLQAMSSGGPSLRHKDKAL